MKKHLIWILPALTGAILIGLWYAIIIIGGQPHYVLPSPWQILEACVREREMLIPAALRTGFAAIVGFVAAVGGGSIIALVLASSRWVHRAFYPWVLVMQMTPLIVLVPIFVLWFGEGLPSITAITFGICFFPVVANTTMGLISTDKNLLDLFRMSNASFTQEIFLLRMPYALPYFLTGVKIAGTLAPIGAITGDFLAGTASTYAGLGYLVQNYRSQIMTAELFAVAFVGCIIGFIFVASVNFVHWYLLHNWHESSLKADH